MYRSKLSMLLGKQPFAKAMLVHGNAEPERRYARSDHEDTITLEEGSANGILDTPQKQSLPSKNYSLQMELRSVDDDLIDSDADELSEKMAQINVTVPGYSSQLTKNRFDESLESEARGSPTE